MQKLQWFGLGLGCLVGGVMMAAPAHAQIGGELSDVSGIGLSSTSTGFGFTGTGALGGVTSLSKAVVEMADALLETESPTDLIAANKVLLSVPEEASSETRASLLAFKDYLDTIQTQPWRDSRIFDRHLQTISTNLLKDVETANAACQSQGAAACERLNRLVANADQLLNAMDTLEQELISRLPKARTF
ncbi:MAG: hypothetical protein SFW36_11900 [Leptolyngbyaceae cyanobacterium bins.59]|nr:hypothetical protein [Leptolyngbyaceae cyanobacterium bins.59]